jgi:phenylacetate-CoA ligase
LRSFLSAAQVPYWRDLFAHLSSTCAVTGVPDLQSLPLLDKGTSGPRRRHEASGPVACHGQHGGSSGEPLVFYIGSER